MPPFELKKALLKQHGFIVGERDPNAKTPFPGKWMVYYPDDYLIVGEDLVKLVDEAFGHFDLTGAELKDWQEEDGGPSAFYGIDTEADRIDIVFTSGESIWIERQDGRIRVHCFHAKNDAPVNVEIYGDRIEVDRHDHDVEA
ncbi:hypothetical protein MHM88_14645 [Epibacterium sp. MM17-32]|uniref:hypothetical protein n=1 Tax=Epibacterium sp. MM17-32 TaxID=2917734 RepID=UPI001EF40356|nr:hypothetical protein [Epibacterium sp. MM17-32]MCG7629047.1 hypothetical protein [Epibacterium sp. MM17-32]